MKIFITKIRGMKFCTEKIKGMKKLPTPEKMLRAGSAPDKCPAPKDGPICTHTWAHSPGMFIYLIN